MNTESSGTAPLNREESHEKHAVQENPAGSVPERMTLLVQSEQYKRMQFLQEKVDQLRERTDKQWDAYHSGQMQYLKLEKACNDFRNQLQSLKTASDAKEIEKQIKANENNHSLHRIDESLHDLRNRKEELRLARNELVAFTAIVNNQVHVPENVVIPPPPATSQAALRDYGSVKRERQDDIEPRTDDRDRHDSRADSRHRVSDHRQFTERRSSTHVKRPRRDPCPYFNRASGCYNNEYTCRREHICCTCFSASHAVMDCGVEITYKTGH